MKETILIYDYDGNKVSVGTKVKDYDDTFDDIGEVIEISDFDGDVDDDTGRSIMHPPLIKVRWADGEEQEYHTSEWEFHEYGIKSDANGDPMPEGIESIGKVEELKVVT